MAVGKPSTAANGKPSDQKKKKVSKKRRISKNKQQQQKKANPDTPIENPIASRSRDHQTDLKNYLEQWRNRDGGSNWKFNKVLQTWAIANALNKDEVDKELFRELCPYLHSVSGGAKERFMTILENVLDQNSEETTVAESSDKPDDGAVKTKLKRAAKLHRLFLSTTDSSDL